MSKTRFCTECGRARQAGEHACTCGGDLYGAQVPGTAQARADDSAQLGGVLAGVRLPPGELLLAYGRRGTGKTTLLLDALARAAPNALHVATSEMLPEVVLSYARRLGLSLDGLSVPDVDAGGLTDLGLPARPVPVLVDSITRCPHPESAFERLILHARRYGVPVAAILQVTKDGDPRGPATFGHDAFVLVKLEAGSDGLGTATIEKNRGGALFSRAYQLGAEGLRLPSWDRYYSIEGSAPDYRASPWPSGGKYADPFRHSRALGRDLPPPPAAMAAERVELYAGGWIQPPDVDARAEFARAAGLPFYKIEDLPCRP